MRMRNLRDDVSEGEPAAFVTPPQECYAAAVAVSGSANKKIFARSVKFGFGDTARTSE